MCGCASPCNCDLNFDLGPAGLQGDPGPSNVLTIGTVTTLAAGEDATASITGTSPDQILNLGIPVGATGAGTPGTDGTDGINAYSTLASGYTQPAVDFNTTITLVDGSWVANGQWIYVTGGGFYQVSGVAGNVITIENIGTVGNVAGGMSVSNGGAVSPAGVPGAIGATGAAGATGATGTGSIVSLVTTIPTTTPPPGYEFQFYTDSLTLPTIFRAYSWNGSVWTAGPNILSGFGSTTLVTLTAGPVSVPVNFQYSRTNITTTSADFTLAFNLTNLVDHGTWQVNVVKIGGGSITMSYTSTWDKKTGVTLPTTIAAGETWTFVIRMGYDTARPIIEDVYSVIPT